MILTLLVLLSCGGSPVEPLEELALAASAPRVAAPTYSPASGTYIGTQSVTVRTSSTGAAIYCTTDGSRPRRSAGLRYLAPLSVSTSQTVRCLAATLDGRDSRSSSAAYVINAAEPPPPAGGYAAACAAEAEPTTNIVYACACESGAQAGCTYEANQAARDGTKAHPWATWAEVQTAWRALPPGGTVALCKGGAFAANSDGIDKWVNARCANSPCTLRDYQAAWGGAARPLILPDASMNGMTLWGGSGQGIGGYRVLNLKFYMPGGGTATNQAIRAMDYIANVEVCNCEIDGFGMGIHAAGAFTDTACSATGWKIRGNRILNNCAEGLLLSLSNSEIVENYMDNNGNSKGYPACGYACGATIPGHTMYMDGGTQSSGGCRIDGITFRGNEVHRNDALCTGYPRGSALGVGARNAHNVVMENNFVDWLPCKPSPTDTDSGSSFVGGNGECPTCPGNSNITLRRNRIAHCAGSAISFDSTANALVEDNLIVMENPSAPGGAIYVPQGKGAYNQSSAVIRNNTVYVKGGGDSPIWATAYNSLSSGHAVTGNSVTFTGSGTSCYRVTDPTKMDFMNNNHCSGASAFATVDGFTHYALVNWRSYISSLNLGRQFDTNSITAAPQFKNAPTDFTPCMAGDAGCSGTSPLIGAASTAQTCTVLGVANQPCSSSVAIDSPTWSPTATAKPRDGAPDIGAMER